MTFSDWLNSVFSSFSQSLNSFSQSASHAVNQAIYSLNPQPVFAPTQSLTRATQISQNGLNFIAGTETYGASVYKDQGGYPTIGYGHRLVSGDGFNQYSTITPAAAWSLLQRDVQTAVNCINSKVRIALSQNQFDALTSFVFNIGCGAFGSSTILGYLNQGNIAAAANEFPRWVYTGGKFSQGLQNRRYAERSTFLA